MGAGGSGRGLYAKWQSLSESGSTPASAAI